MLANQEDLADIVSRIVPEDATDEASLMAASAFAAGHRDEIIAQATKVASGSYGYHAKKDGFVRFAIKRLLALRNGWLKDHGAYRHG